MSVGGALSEGFVDLARSLHGLNLKINEKNLRQRRREAKRKGMTEEEGQGNDLTKEQKKYCNRRESNPGLPRGRRKSYH